MHKFTRFHLLIVGETLLLLAVTLGILAYFSHKALREEAMRNAELMLDGTVQNIDNILLSVEQATGRIYDDLLEHLDQPDRMYAYSRDLVESNPYINGCAICFKPGYYPGKDLFMAYVHHVTSAKGTDSALVTSETFTNRPYTEQVWYAEPMKTGWTGWTDPLKGPNTECEPLVTFCLPITDKHNERVGVIGVDVSLHQLSEIILAAKPSENGYSILLAHNGLYIVHPDKEKLINPNIFSQKGRDVDASELDAAKAMVNGESGKMTFRRDHCNWWVFYKPFETVERKGRSSGDINWSVGVVYPEEDIFGKHNVLLWLVLGIIIAGLLVFYILGRWMICKQLKPVKKLAASANHIAEGNYNETLPFIDRHDEIGLLQNRFKQMQHSLQDQVEKLKEKMAVLYQHGNIQHAAYDKTLEVDKMKTSFLNYMTNQISVPVEGIDKAVTALCNNYQELSKEEKDRLVDNIQLQTQKTVELLDHVAHFAETETGKEAPND